MTFDSGVTHLICGIADRKQSTTLDTVYQLRRGYVGTSEERKGATQLHCVWIDWVEDCDKVGGCIPEDEYDVWKPTTGNRKPKKPDMSLRAQVTSHFPPRDGAQMKQRCIEKMKENQENYVKALEQKQRSSKTSKQTSTPQPQPERPSVKKESKSASRTSTPANSTDHKKPSHSSKPTSGLLSMSRNVKEEEQPQQKVQHRDTDNPASPSRSVCRPLAGTHIHIDLSDRDHTKLGRVREACMDAGAKLILDDSQWAAACKNEASRAFILVSVLCPPKQRAEQVEEQRRLKRDYKLSQDAVPLVTLSWLEQCIHWNRLIDPRHIGDIDPTGYPYLPIIRAPGVNLTLPLQHVRQYTIALTNFPAYDASPHRTQITQAFTQLGLQVTETFGRKQNTHLYSRFAERLRGMTSDEMEKWGKQQGVSVIKETKAQLWGIPVVGIDFLRRLWHTGEVTSENESRTVETQALGPNQSVSLMEETQFGVPGDQGDTSAELKPPVTRHAGPVNAHPPAVEAIRKSEAPKAEGDQAQTTTPPPHTDAPPATSRNGSTTSTHPEASAAIQPIRPAVLVNESLAGQSMWATKMQDQVEALLASRSGTVSSSSITDNPAAPRTKGKLPPKSRRSAGFNRSNTPGAGSPAASSATTATRPGSISPLKSSVVPDDTAATTNPPSHYEDESATGAATSIEAAEETMRVTYRDPAAEKERRKLEELLERGGRERKLMQVEEEKSSASVSPAAAPQPPIESPPRRGGGPDLYGTGKNRPPPPQPPISDQSPKKKIVARRQPGSRS